MSKIPNDISVLTQSRQLQLDYPDKTCIKLDFEYLRVFSPSAEVRGHGKGQEVLQAGKSQVQISNLHTSGNYALQLIFDDGHDSGIYSWDYLYQLGSNYAANWQDYLDRLEAAGASRDPDTQVLTFEP